MEHLSVDEIIEYVTANNVDRKTLDLLSKVNGHIRMCSECRRKVNAFEIVNDKIKRDVYEKDADLSSIKDLIKKSMTIDESY